MKDITPKEEPQKEEELNHEMPSHVQEELISTTTADATEMIYNSPDSEPDNKEEAIERKQMEEYCKKRNLPMPELVAEIMWQDYLKNPQDYNFNRPLKSIEDCKNEIAKKYKFESWAAFDPNNEWQPECDEVVELYANQFKSEKGKEEHSWISGDEQLNARKAKMLLYFETR